MKSNQVRPIESSQNPQFKLWRKLTESQGVKKEGRFILSGSKLVEELLVSDFLDIEALIATPEHVEKQHESLRSAGKTPIYTLPKELFQELDLIGTHSPLLIGKIPAMGSWSQESPARGAEVFLALQDPGNLGAALRVCEAFGVSQVILLSEACHPFHMRALKGASGSTFRLRLLKGPSIRELRAPDSSWLGLDADGIDIRNFKAPTNFRLILGEEGAGLPDHLRSGGLQTLRIPMSEKIESLNASVALGISLYALQPKVLQN